MKKIILGSLIFAVLISGVYLYSKREVNITPGMEFSKVERMLGKDYIDITNQPVIIIPDARAITWKGKDFYLLINKDNKVHSVMSLKPYMN